jgi:hypothetical protein
MRAFMPPEQSGFVGPIEYQQDNSGVADDKTTTLTHTPRQFGAPVGAQNIADTVTVQYDIGDGTTGVQNLHIQPDAAACDVHTKYHEL